MYKVVCFFTDLQDNNHPYNVGDTFPREGVKVSEARLKELSSDSNRQGFPLIAEAEKAEAGDSKPVKRKRKSCGCEVIV